MLAARTSRRRAALPLAAVGLLSAALVGAVGAAPGPGAFAAASPPTGSTPTLDVEELQVGPGGAVTHTARAVHPEFTRELGAKGLKADAIAARPAVKISKRFAALRPAGAGGSDQRVKVVVTFVEDQKIPRFPDYDQTQPDTAAVNAAARATADRLVRGIAASREPGYRAVRGDIEKLGGRVLDTYWLTKGVHAEVPRSAVAALAARSDVRHIEPDEAAVTPSAGNTERAARALLGTDPYFTAGRTGDRVAILDTGVQSDHLLLSNPSALGVGLDFTGEGEPFTDKCNHGTKTAGVIAANNNLGNEYRGISAIKVNVYKIFPNDGLTPCKGNSNTVVQAFQSAVQRLEKVIVGAFGGSGTEDDTAATNADAAFDAGAVVILANGNSGPGARTVTSPGSARKVLGIGAVDVQTFERYAQQSEGPTGDGRFKPDLVAPTNVETASTTNVTGIYGGTSSATSHAGGTAAVLRNFLRGSATDIEPGHVYAGMILGGSNAGGAFDNIQGAGKLRLSPLPGPGAIYQKFSMTDSDGSSIGVTFNVTVPATTPSTCRLSGSLWWGEKAGAHNDFDIQLIDPSGVVRASSASGASVFELARVNAPLQAGTWKVKVFPFKPVIGTQKVYGAVSTCR
jgi:hypothetical protein